MWTEDVKFAGFGPNSLDPHAPRQLTEVGGKLPGELRKAVRTSVPKLPGVYGMLDRDERLIYVGKSKSLRNRLLSYFNPAVAEEKAGRIITAAERIVWEESSSEFAALLREQQLIRRWTPRWNVQEMPRRQRSVYLCLGRGPAAYFFLSRVPPKDTLACEGPFRGAGRMGQAVDALNTFFRLRDCKNSQGFHFSNQLSLFDVDHRPGCLRFEIGTCSGPCAAAVSLESYNSQLNQARSFLDGFNAEPLMQVQESMERAARDLNFEHAAKLRDDWRSLNYLYRQLAWLAEARGKYTFVYSVPGHDGLGIWYFIRAGEVNDVVSAPTCPATYGTVRKTVKRWAVAAEQTVDRGHGPYPHTLSLVASWFRKNAAQLQRAFPPAEAGRKYRGLARSAVA
ncbi:GIY-YIG nuclease family protein [Planctomycetaceae bacterium SH139]